MTCSRPPQPLKKMGPHKRIEFADFDVNNAWQFSKYNERRDPIFKVEKIIARYRIKEKESVHVGRLSRR